MWADISVIVIKSGLEKLQKKTHMSKKQTDFGQHFSIKSLTSYGTLVLSRDFHEITADALQQVVSRFRDCAQEIELVCLLCRFGISLSPAL